MPWSRAGVTATTPRRRRSRLRLCRRSMGDVAGKRVGVAPSLMNAEGLTPEMKQAVEGAAHALEAAGAELVEIDLPHLDAAIAAYYVIGPAEAFSNLARFDGIRYGYQEPGCATLAQQSSLSRAHGFGAEPSVARCSVPICSLRACMTSILRGPKGAHNHYRGLCACLRAGGCDHHAARPHGCL